MQFSCSFIVKVTQSIPVFEMTVNKSLARLIPTIERGPQAGDQITRRPHAVLRRPH